MNTLNSILIEGVVTERDAIVMSGVVCMTIESTRFHKLDNRLEKETMSTSIRIYGKLARTCVDHLSIGHGVRIVGRLAQDALNGKMYIVAEHVEFKSVVRETEPMEVSA